MDWSAHIDYVYNKLLKCVGIFYKLQYKVPSKCLRNIYYAFVYPHYYYIDGLVYNYGNSVCENVGLGNGG